MASIKEKFESHPVIFGSFLLIVGFSAGYKVYPELHPISEQEKLEPIVKVEKVREVIGCEVVGFETLQKNHHNRLSVLQRQLMQLESDAADKNNYVYSNGYRDAAKRVRDDITVQTRDYEKSLSMLRAVCSKVDSSGKQT
ncbi:hypothetical protein ACSVJV_003622 [Vibrio cholerae]|uniref:hypothetical protein n=1 Tax=Vibrio cholerae TaxID=666 RepID=UPI00115B4C15|nr:hypothetical protein [Vibrio cholerae]EHD7131467.1 hypothetical protein [Vibrio cholerae]EKC3496265.1 hypothetical protein [Vibrio cholerae]EKF9125239.1 hypothetical protein [Vibrio cholerae]EKF9143547.1 hypothetical protein [Vibrio cholerae]EKZ8642500.1 hypothetical protein [Vibrio cholerae]